MLAPSYPILLHEMAFQPFWVPVTVIHKYRIAPNAFFMLPEVAANESLTKSDITLKEYYPGSNQSNLIKHVFLKCFDTLIQIQIK